MIGVVEEIDGRMVKVRGDPCGDSCFGCLAHEAACGGPRQVVAWNPASLAVSKGSRVEVVSPRTSVAVDACVSCLPPLVGLAAGYAVARALSLSEGARGACAALGLFAAGALVFLLRRRFPARGYPRLSRVLG